MKTRLTLITMFAALSACASTQDLSGKDYGIENNYSVVRLEPKSEQGHGTGFAVKVDGKTVVVTNAHVCNAGLEDGKMVAASIDPPQELKILKVSHQYDLCVLEAFKGAKPYKLSKLTAPAKGSNVHTLGFPALKALQKTEGKFLGFMNYENGLFIWLSENECKAAGGRWTYVGPNNITPSFFICLKEETLWISTLKLDGGASGSPLLNDKNQVVGVVSVAVGRNGLAGGVPLHHLKEFLGVKDSGSLFKGTRDPGGTGEHKRL